MSSEGMAAMGKKRNLSRRLTHPRFHGNSLGCAKSPADAVSGLFSNPHPLPFLP